VELIFKTVRRWRLSHCDNSNRVECAARRDSGCGIVGLEVLNVSQRVENPRGVDYAVTA